jgi:hypothetical protein
MIAAQTSVTDLAPGFGSLAIIFAIAAVARQKQPIGGWLLFFYGQIYVGALFSAVLFSKSYRVYTLRPWSNEVRHIMFIVAAVPRLLGFLIVATIASILLVRRNLQWLERLRFVIAIELLFIIIDLIIDLIYSPSAFRVNFGQFALFFAWFGYFYGSQRVHRVFVTHDWASEA